MNNSKGKYIGLNQRIPFDVLDSSVQLFLMDGHVERHDVFQQMLRFTSGLNRANKAAGYVAQILLRQAGLLNLFKKQLKDLPYNELRTDDRKAFCLCLVCLTYPITYDLLVALAQGFKVQDQINKKFINEKVKSIYGSNRTVDVAIDALLPMIIELNTIRRDKVSIYSKASLLTMVNQFISELVIFTDIKLSGSKSILIDDLAYKPWYSYFDISIVNTHNFSQLVSKKESSVGSGYLRIS